MDDEYEVGLPPRPGPDEWIRVTGGGLSQPISVKVRSDSRGRPILTGLLIDEGTEISARGLRELKPPKLVDAVIAGTRELRDHFGQVLGDETQWPSSIGAIEVAADQGYPGAAELLEVVWEGAMALKLDEYIAALQEPASETPLGARGRGSRAPTEAEYQKFARAWLETSRDHGAYRLAERVAQAQQMNRSTVYRWASECRRRGLIPEETGED